jgi:ribosomal protein S18 acetylase RimI-like enzyme
MTTTITIREYRDQDEEALIALLRELQAYECGFNLHYKPASAIGAWYVELLKQHCAEKGGVILMALDRSAYAGMAVVFTRVEEKGEAEEMAHVHAHVSEIVVTEAARGRGIGKALLAECERRARLAGRDELTLSVFPGNTAARRLYLAAGYEDFKISQRKQLGDAGP